MLTVELPEHLAKRLQEMAERENRSVNELVTSLVEEYIAPTTTSEDESVDPFDAIDGILDYDVTAMSTTVKETMRNPIKTKNRSLDRRDFGLFRPKHTDFITLLP